MTTDAKAVQHWTLEQNATIDGLQQKLGWTRIKAIHKLREGEKAGKTPEQILTEATAAKAKPAAKPIRQPKELNKRLSKMGDEAPHVKAIKSKGEGEVKISKGDAKHYDRRAVIDGFLKHGKTITELADAQKMSHVYAHRILTTKVPEEYAAEQKRRAEGREKAKATKGKPA
jgi:hypothetical protein